MLFFQFFNSTVALKNITKIGPSKKNLKWRPCPTSSRTLVRPWLYPSQRLVISSAACALGLRSDQFRDAILLLICHSHWTHFYSFVECCFASAVDYCLIYSCKKNFRTYRNKFHKLTCWCSQYRLPVTGHYIEIQLVCLIRLRIPNSRG